MSVLVKGMEMPENCFYCSMSHFEGKRLFCNRLYDEVLRRKVDPDCPLVELPPHGRLIDADALLEHLGDTEYKGAVKRVLMQAPTIIEAEEG